MPFQLTIMLVNQQPGCLVTPLLVLLSMLALNLDDSCCVTSLGTEKSYSGFFILMNELFFFLIFKKHHLAL